MSASDIVDRHSRYGTSSPIGNRSMFSSLAANDHASMVSSNSAAGASNSARGVPLAPPSSASVQSSSVAGAGAGALSKQQQQQQQQMRPDSSALGQTSAYHHYNRQEGATELPISSSSPQRGGTQNQNANQTQAQDPSPRGESGVSAFSEREKMHLRNISDPATVSTMDGGTIVSSSSPPLGAQQHGRFSPHPRPIMEEGTLASLYDDNNHHDGGGGDSRGQTAVVSPPTAGDDADGEDYLSAKGSAGEVSPVAPPPTTTTTEAGNGGLHPEQQLPPRPGSSGNERRSAFRESAEDMDR